jgi:hypothetical protein
MATFENAAYNAAPPGAGNTTETIIELYVSDATTVTQGSMKITTVDTDGTSTSQDDAVLPPIVSSFSFDSGGEGWTWFDIPSPDLISPAHAASGGALTITEATGHTSIVFGGWESPKDPTVAVMPKLGCVFAVRYQMASSGHATPALCPGFRMRGATTHVIDAGGGVWQPDFANLDSNSLDQVFYGTIDFMMASGDFDERVPGAGKEFTMMIFPRQVSEMLLSDDPNSPVIHYFSIDMLDLEGSVDADHGTLTIDSVMVEAIDRPEIGTTGTAVPGLSFATADFGAGWTAGTTTLPPGPIQDTGLSATATASGLAIDVQPGNEFFVAFCEAVTGETTIPGQTYRVAFWCTSDEQPGTPGPLVRTSLDSSRFIWNALKELPGGALLAHLTDTPDLMELWLVAPTEMASTPGLTEPMKLKFSSFQGENTTASWPQTNPVQGLATCTQIDTESFDW